MSTILAADTSTSFCTVALWRDRSLLAESTLARERLHSERLLEMLDTLFHQTDLTLETMDALAITKGPGSFTGLRVGVAAFKGLALGACKPLVGVPTLDAMARLAPVTDGLVCPLIDARMEEVFGAVYEVKNGRPKKSGPEYIGPVEALIADLGEPVYFLGDGAEKYRARIDSVMPDALFASAETTFPRASAVAAEAESMLEAGACSDPALLEPVYLRKSQAEQARDARLARETAT